jgi:hypothetical protein
MIDYEYKYKKYKAKYLKLLKQQRGGEQKSHLEIKDSFKFKPITKVFKEETTSSLERKSLDNIPESNKIKIEFNANILVSDDKNSKVGSIDRYIPKKMLENVYKKIFGFCLMMKEQLYFQVHNIIDDFTITLDKSEISFTFYIKIRYTQEAIELFKELIAYLDVWNDHGDGYYGQDDSVLYPLVNCDNVSEEGQDKCLDKYLEEQKVIVLDPKKFIIYANNKKIDIIEDKNYWINKKEHTKMEIDEITNKASMFAETMSKEITLKSKYGDS